MTSSKSITRSSSRQTEDPVIGKYRLIKTIGKGNFAKVKLAKHLPTDREVTSLRYSCYVTMNRCLIARVYARSVKD